MTLPVHPFIPRPALRPPLAAAMLFGALAVPAAHAGPTNDPWHWGA